MTHVQSFLARVTTISRPLQPFILHSSKILFKSTYQCGFRNASFNTVRVCQNGTTMAKFRQKTTVTTTGYRLKKAQTTSRAHITTDAKKKIPDDLYSEVISHNQKLKKIKESSRWELFKSSARKGKPQLINIGASALCLVFAFQSFDSQAKGRKIKSKLADMEASMADLNIVIDKLQGANFASSVAAKCQKDLLNGDNKKKGILGFVSRGVKEENIRGSSKAECKIANIVQEEIRIAIENKGLGSDQMQHVQKNVNLPEDVKEKELANLVSLVENLSEKDNEPENGAVRVVKKRKILL